MRARASKYGNRRTEVDGISFASKAEATRYAELKLLEKAGEITHLMLQPKYPVTIRNIHCFTYVADFLYIDRANLLVIEDVKGVSTALFNLKKRCVEAAYGVTIALVKVRG